MARVRTLSRQLRQPQVGGEPLPPVFYALSAIGADVRRGEVMMLAGQPTAGKSIVALWHAVVWNKRHGLRGIYWSADALARPVAARVIGQLTGDPVTRIEKELDDKVLERLAVLDELSRNGFHWVFDASITGDSLELNVEAFRELWGTEPDWIVIDNLTDVDTRDGEEFSVLRATMRDVNYIARETNSGLLVLHHVSEEYPERPIAPRKAVHGKVSVKPTVILGTARSVGGHRKPIGPLKNRYGFEDKSGHYAEFFLFDPASMRFEGVQP